MRVEFIRLAAMLAILLPAWSTARAQDRLEYEEVSVRDVLTDVRDRTGYQFLYRDALIAGKEVTFESDSDELVSSFDRALRVHDLHLQVDSARRQILVVELMERSVASVRGVVMDDEHGTRLPFATVTWNESGRLRGVAANESGAFDLELESGTDRTAVVTVSYVGYRSKQVEVDLSRPPAQLPVRLRPEAAFGPEIVVSTAALQTEIDTVWHHLLQAGIFSPVGEGGVLRSLQTLPSVSLSTALSPGLNVRGSRADGFQVLLDGMSIYNQSHFFGLFDAFNEEVLQAVGLFYGVTPADMQGPPGGTLSLLTRTGSQTQMRGAIGLSNTSVKATVEGPFLDGRGSWLLSGRRSYLNAVDWFNNAELIGLGLDVGRTNSLDARPVHEIRDLALQTGEASASFFDVHGKFFVEWASGVRLTLNAYMGGDETLHDAERLTNDARRREPVLLPATTTNDWGNESASLRLQAPLGARAFSQSLLGFSRYRSDYSKDDFLYADPTRALILPMDTSRHVIRPFSNENELLELKLAQDVGIPTETGSSFSAGYALHRYEIMYREQSALHERFDATPRSTQLDLFAQYESTDIDPIAVLAGLRTHYFSLGEFFRLSPRLRLRLFPDSPLSLGAGFSRNHQFIHRLYVEQSTHADIWMMSLTGQPPGSVDQITAGIYVTASPTTYLQAEVYRKRFDNLREHEASAARRRLSSPLLDPWLHDNQGLARGLEIMVRKEMGALLWTNSYTLSSMEIWNERVNDGQRYPADWDRRHQFTSHLRIAPIPGLEMHLAWVYGSGAPNSLASVDPREPDRLRAYQRLDASVKWQRKIGRSILEIGAGIFNLYDRSNTWYRSPVGVVGRTPDGHRVGLINADVYDLGLQPSFEVGWRF
ncbi:MAG: TonB-dependent receptor [Rhodothermales bacterium]